MSKNRKVSVNVSMITEPIKTARGRMNMSTPELWLMLAGAFITIYWIATYFERIGAPAPVGYGSNYLQLNNLLIILSNICIYLVYGLTIYLTAMLSLYFDEKYRMANDSIISSDFTFTRLVSPIARAIVLLIALILITGVNIYILYNGVFVPLIPVQPPIPPPV